MSQEKVDKYKKDKANRKKLIAKQKRQEFLEKSVVTLIGLALVAFIVISAYFKWFHKEKATVAEAATYSLSEEEISSVWEAHENPTEEETTSSEDISEEETIADETDNTANDVSTDEADNKDNDVDSDIDNSGEDSDSNEDVDNSDENSIEDNDEE